MHKIYNKLVTLDILILFPHANCFVQISFVKHLKSLHLHWGGTLKFINV